MKNNILPVAAVVLPLCIILATGGSSASAGKKAAKTMEFTEFIGLVKGDDCVITVEGAPKKSFFTGREYVHYETVAFSGAADIRSRHRILYHTDGDITIIHGDARTTARYSQVRTCLAPVYDKQFARKDLKSGTEVETRLISLMDEDAVDTIELAEYGLEKGKKYHARLKTESYHLPPRERGGRPERRENTVLVISDRPFPDDVEMTPLYRDWSY